ncbi:hypothetical protein [Facklamia hominis]|uniref:hypothetical protein n=1 Tax=Facklamia hominis TaxID=178214 RepID=UPI00101C042D|nr:hypothetical protein [Facklamia hominis]RYC97375.1 hypothetical protein EKN08_08500 [Facklamia hominis]
MKPKPKSNASYGPNKRVVWPLLAIILFSLGMLLWLNRQQEANSELETIPSQESRSVTSGPSSQDPKGRGSSSHTESSLEEEDESDNLAEQYAKLPKAETYSSIEYHENQIHDPHVRRAFEVVIERLKAEGKYYSSVDYELTVFPTLDENISNLSVDERYADRTVHRGHYRFDYRGKKVTRY